MRATKKRADVIYNVLLKHFKVDEFLVRYSKFDKKIVICTHKNSFVRDLEVCHKSLEFKWATKRIFTKCSCWPNLHRGALSLEYFFYALKEVSWDFKLNRKSLIDIKHELVKQILSSLRQYEWIRVNAVEDEVSMFGRTYIVDRIESLEELVIQEELNAEVNKDNVPLI
jgi:hypothetical protein